MSLSAAPWCPRTWQVPASTTPTHRRGALLLRELCVFPDHPRRRASEHFINLPRDAKGLTSDQCPQADKCVLTAILADSKVLASKAETDADRLIALKSVERNGLNIKAVDIAEFAKIVKIVEPATDMTGARFAFGIFIYP